MSGGVCCHMAPTHRTDGQGSELVRAVRECQWLWSVWFSWLIQYVE